MRRRSRAVESPTGFPAPEEEKQPLDLSMENLLLSGLVQADEGAPIERQVEKDPVAWVRHARPLIDAKEEGFGLLPFDPWPHQEEVMRAQFNGESIVVDKSRQTGVTTALMIGMAHGLLYGRPWHGHVIAQQEPVAVGVMLEMAKLALKTATLSPAQRANLKIRGKSISYYDGTRNNYIRAHSAGPYTARSHPGNRVLLEEVAFMAYAEDIFRSIAPMLDDGSGAVALVSTYNGDGDFFCGCVDHAEEMNMRHIPVDWRARPDRDDEWKRKSLARFPGRVEEWEEEHELQRMSAGDAIFNVDAIRQWARECADLCRRPKEHPIAGHQYVKGVDVDGGGRAVTVLSAFDVTDVPYLAVQQPLRPLAFPAKMAEIVAFDDKFPNREGHKPALFIDGGGPGQAVVSSMADRTPRPMALRLIGGAAPQKRKRDPKTLIFWQNEPRDRLVTYSAMKLEAGAVIIPLWFDRLYKALKAARWEKERGVYVDELDSLMIGSFDIESRERSRVATRGGFRGLPSTDRLRKILRIR